MCERRFTNHAVRPKTVAIYTTPVGILRLSPNNRTAKVLLFKEIRTKTPCKETDIYELLTKSTIINSSFYLPKWPNNA